mmetsp:Transcript_29790/g.45426  ORF Transcript_29790/g.45426 Transcript_29790/m.45426 type:complete len:126 (+) Transcript_29790:2111-2488(+)
MANLENNQSSLQRLSQPKSGFLQRAVDEYTNQPIEEAPAPKERAQKILKSQSIESATCIEHPSRESQDPGISQVLKMSMVSGEKNLEEHLKAIRRTGNLYDNSNHPEIEDPSFKPGGFSGNFLQT